MRFLLVLIVLAVLAALFVRSLLGVRRARAEPQRASPAEDLRTSRRYGGEVTWWTDGDDFL